MKFPAMTTTTINLPTSLLEQIDTYATQRLLNRSACVRNLVIEALRDQAPSGLHRNSPHLMSTMIHGSVE